MAAGEDSAQQKHKNLLGEFEIHCSPEHFLNKDDRRSAFYTSSIKSIHDCLHYYSESFGELTELWVAGSDSDQIWEQIQLTNKPFLQFLKKQIRSLPSWNGVVLAEEDSNDEEQKELDLPSLMENSVPSDSEDEPDGGIVRKQHGFESEVFSDSEKSESEGELVENTRKSVVDDQFFKLSEMEAFLDKEDRLAMRGDGDRDYDADDDNLDYFREFPTSGSQEAIHYQDFFDPPFPAGEDYESDYSEEDSTSMVRDQFEDEKMEVENGLSDGDSSDLVNSDKEELSSHQLKLSRIQDKVRKLEMDNMADKPWQLIGEVSEKLRPENSLLEQNLEYDHITRTAPVITEETTQKLEDIILQRIKDEAWDDVERKVKPKEAPYNYRVVQPLNQEKSQVSLAQVYEEDYLKQTAKEGDVGEKEDERHAEIKKLMEKLFLKLDALSNFRYTPKPLKKDIKIVSNVPTLSIEEATPIAANDRDILAPEEVQPKRKAYEQEDSELTSTDKKRKRRKWKRKAHFTSLKRAQREKLVTRLNPGLGNKYSKKAALKLLDKASNARVKDLMDKDGGKKVVKTSTQMFSQLQDMRISKGSQLSHEERKKPRGNLKL